MLLAKIHVVKEQRKILNNLKINIMAKSQEGKERKNVKKEAVKSLKEKRADKAAKKSRKSDSSLI